MAIRRTKEEKQQAVVRRVEKLHYQYVADAGLTPVNKPAAKSSAHSVETDLLTFNFHFVKQDLLRTLAASTLVFGILIALYFTF